MTQSHFTFAFPLKAQPDTKALAGDLARLMPALFQAADTIGTVHYSRFTLLSERTLLFLVDFDGEFGPLMSSLATLAGPVFDTAFKYVDGPPPSPVADHAAAFVEWAAEHLLHPLNVYTAYPEVTVKEIKALAAAADVTGAGVLNPFLVILPIKSQPCLLRGRTASARPVAWNNERSGYRRHAAFRSVRAFGGQSDRFLHRLRRLLRRVHCGFHQEHGHVFDLIFKFTKNPPPSPCQ